MSIRNYIIIIAACTGVCWLAWLMVLFFINPEMAGLVGVFAFYVSLFFAFVGTFSLLGFFVRNLFKREEIVMRLLNVSSRQAIILSLVIIASLIMQSYQYLFWWNLLILVVIAVLVELFIVSYRRK